MKLHSWIKVDQGSFECTKWKKGFILVVCLKNSRHVTTTWRKIKDSFYYCSASLFVCVFYRSSNSVWRRWDFAVLSLVEKSYRTPVIGCSHDTTWYLSSQSGGSRHFYLSSSSFSLSSLQLLVVTSDSRIIRTVLTTSSIFSLLQCIDWMLTICLNKTLCN